MAKPKTTFEQKRELYKAILRLQEKAWKLGMTKTNIVLRKANATAFDELVGKKTND